MALNKSMYCQFIHHTRCITWCPSPQIRHYSKIKSEPIGISPSPKTIKRKLVDMDLIEYLGIHSPSHVKSVPEKHLKRTKNIKILYLANSQTAASVAKILKPHIEKVKSEIIECHPGLGLLTEHLLKMKTTKINLHEPDPDFYQNLLNVSSAKHVNIFNNDILQVPKFAPGKKKLDAMLDYIERKTWEDDCIYQLIGSLNDQEFLRYLLNNFTNQNGILSYGRPIMYLFINSTTYQKLIAGPHQPWNLYKPLAVLFQIIFHIKLLDILDRRAFIPWPTNSSIDRNTAEKFAAGKSPMYLIKIEGKKDVYQKIGQHNIHRVKSLQKFVTHAIGRKKQRVIPTIEQWIPGFAPHLIARNINVYTLFNELRPEEIFDIFCMINHIPGYEEFAIPPPPDSMDEVERKRIDTSIDLFLDEEEVEEPEDGTGKTS